MLKTIKGLLLFFIGILHGVAQNESINYKNGLLYSKEAMSKLSHIVDSLHIKFKKSDLNNSYLAKSQGRVHCIQVEETEIDAVIEDLRKNMEYDVFKKKYKELEIDENVYIISRTYSDYNDQLIVGFMGAVSSHNIEAPDNYQGSKDVKEKTWLYKIKEKEGKRSMMVFYIVDNFKPLPLPEKYSRMVEYRHCLIDTNTVKLKHSSRKGNGEDFALLRFKYYLESKINNMNTKLGNNYRPSFYFLSSQYEDQINNLLKTKEGQYLFKNALKSVLESQNSTPEFEAFVERYDTKENTLKLKLSREVHSYCSMDRAPRILAEEIAVLSAETGNWKVFLKAHLRIINQRLSLLSDIDPGYKQRETYIRELEYLGINIADLFLGSSLIIDNSTNHNYYMNLDMISQVLVEAKDKPRIENQMIKMIEDKNLDLYNRIQISQLFSNYIDGHNDVSIKQDLSNKLAKAKETLPKYLQ